LKPILLVAFDLDDTLYPERAFVRSGFRVVSEYLLQAGLVTRPLAADFQVAFEADGSGHVFDRVLTAAGVRCDPALIETLVAVYRSHKLPSGPVRPDIQFYPDVVPALAGLRDGGLRLGVISDGPLPAQRTKVEALGVATHVDAVTLTDEWGRDFWKPHPRAFREMAERMAVPPAACVYVADNPAKDFDGPAAAGWQASVRICRANGLHSDAAPPAQGRIAASVTDLENLPEVLDRLG